MTLLYGNPYAVNTRALGAGDAKHREAEGAAQQGVGVADAGAAAMRADAARMRGQAQLVNTQAGRVNQSADALAALVPTLDPYRDKLSGYGDDLAALAASLSEQSKDVFGQGGALVNLDPTKGGLSAEYQKIYDYLSPDRYVSRAASDAQAAADNAWGRTARDLARRGVSSGSAAMGALAAQKSRAVATLLAAARTNARQTGITERGSFLGKMTDAANTLFNMGAQTQGQATAALNAAGDAQKGAAAVVGQQGDLLKNAGALRESAGQLFKSGADIYGSAAGVEGSAANLSLDALKSLQTAFTNAANYYGDIAFNELAADSKVQAVRAQVAQSNNYKIDIHGNAVPN